jgi:hypothetical protein
MIRQILSNNNEKCYRNFSPKIFITKRVSQNTPVPAYCFSLSLSTIDHRHQSPPGLLYHVTPLSVRVRWQEEQSRSNLVATTTTSSSACTAAASGRHTEALCCAPPPFQLPRRPLGAVVHHATHARIPGRPQPAEDLPKRSRVYLRPRCRNLGSCAQDDDTKHAKSYILV